MVGWVIAEGRCRGMILALNEHLVRQVKEIERGERAQGLHNLDELDRHRREILRRGADAGNTPRVLTGRGGSEAVPR